MDVACREGWSMLAGHVTHPRYIGRLSLYLPLFGRTIRKPRQSMFRM